MTNKEAIKYLILPIATSTEPSAEYLKQKEAYELAIKALEERPQGAWVFDGCDDVTCKCMFCGHEHVYVTSPKANGVNFCEQCGADMRGGAKE